uniref:Uncharacterized protein n=1 Tax=Arundo donax TaxID=35708 RepID=A0A0A9A3P8_ARUDO
MVTLVIYIIYIGEIRLIELQNPMRLAI